MSWSFAAIFGGAAAGLALVVIIISFLWCYLVRCKHVPNRNSETGSSDPPAVEWSRGYCISFAGGGPLTEHQGARQFALEELEKATKNFSERNLVGEGRFGVVYKGLLCDGTVVAIKRRVGAPKKEFIEEVLYLSEICHRNLVTLIGYCQEGGLQLLVFEYLPNGSVSGHLYDTGQDSLSRLEFKQRLSVALGVAKGLCHLHGLVPPLIHKDFKTANVLVDENFIAKVADAGVIKLLQRIEDAGSSQKPKCNVFQDPESRELGMLSEMSDVYSFGVFLLELVTGQEATLLSSGSSESLPQLVESRMASNDLIDRRLGSSFTSEGMKDLIRLTMQCLDLFGERRPKMNTVMSEIDRILETEMTLTTVMGDSTAIVTLGSQLFTSA